MATVFEEIATARQGRRKLTRSALVATTATVNGRNFSTNVVHEPPAELDIEFLDNFAPARALPASWIPNLNATARMIASEWGSGPPAGLVALAQVLVNEAKRRGQNVYRTLTGHQDADLEGYFGAQIGRFASTRLDPYTEHATAALAVLQSRAPDLVRGGNKFFSPGSQASGTQDGTAVRSPEEVLSKWYSEGNSWVGPIPTLDTWEFMVLREGSGVALSAALRVVADGRAGRHAPAPGTLPGGGAGVALAALVLTAIKIGVFA